MKGYTKKGLLVLSIFILILVSSVYAEVKTKASQSLQPGNLRINDILIPYLTVDCFTDKCADIAKIADGEVIGIYPDKGIFGDGIVDSTDLLAFASYDGICNKDNSYYDKIDFDNDGCIDLHGKDYSCMLEWLNKETDCSSAGTQLAAADSEEVVKKANCLDVVKYAPGNRINFWDGSSLLLRTISSTDPKLSANPLLKNFVSFLSGFRADAYNINGLSIDNCYWNNYKEIAEASILKENYGLCELIADNNERKNCYLELVSCLLGYSRDESFSCSLTSDLSNKQCYKAGGDAESCYNSATEICSNFEDEGLKIACLTETITSPYRIMNKISSVTLSGAVEEQISQSRSYLQDLKNICHAKMKGYHAEDCDMKIDMEIGYISPDAKVEYSLKKEDSFTQNIVDRYDNYISMAIGNDGIMYYTTPKLELNLLEANLWRLDTNKKLSLETDKDGKYIFFVRKLYAASLSGQYNVRGARIGHVPGTAKIDKIASYNDYMFVAAPYFQMDRNNKDYFIHVIKKSDLNSYDTNSAKRFIGSKLKINGFTLDKVKDIEIDSNGDLFIVINDKIINVNAKRIDSSKDQTLFGQIFADFDDIVQGIDVLDDRILVLTDFRIYILNKKGVLKKEVSHELITSNVDFGSLRGMDSDDNGNIYVGFKDRIFVFNSLLNKFAELTLANIGFYNDEIMNIAVYNHKIYVLARSTQSNDITILSFSGDFIGCGNGLVDGNEACDINKFKGKTCSDFGADLKYGELSCFDSCEIDLSSCSTLAGVNENILLKWGSEQGTKFDEGKGAIGSWTPLERANDNNYITQVGYRSDDSRYIFKLYFKEIKQDGTLGPEQYLTKISDKGPDVEAEVKAPEGHIITGWRWRASTNGHCTSVTSKNLNDPNSATTVQTHSSKCNPVDIDHRDWAYSSYLPSDKKYALTGIGFGLDHDADVSGIEIETRNIESYREPVTESSSVAQSASLPEEKICSGLIFAPDTEVRLVNNYKNTQTSLGICGYFKDSKPATLAPITMYTKWPYDFLSGQPNPCTNGYQLCAFEQYKRFSDLNMLPFKDKSGNLLGANLGQDYPKAGYIFYSYQGVNKVYYSTWPDSIFDDSKSWTYNSEIFYYKNYFSSCDNVPYCVAINPNSAGKAIGALCCKEVT